MAGAPANARKSLPKASRKLLRAKVGLLKLADMTVWKSLTAGVIRRLLLNFKPVGIAAENDLKSLTVGIARTLLIRFGRFNAVVKLVVADTGPRTKIPPISLEPS